MKKLRDSLTLLPSPPKVAMVNISNEKVGLDVNLNHLRVGQMQQLYSTPQSNLTNPQIKAWLMDEINANQVWCVLVPGYLYIFKDEADETPINVIILQRCHVRPQVFKKPYIAPKMNTFNKMVNNETNSFQFLIESDNGKKFLFGVENKAQLDEWVESVEQSIHAKRFAKCSETQVQKGYLTPVNILSNRSFSSSDLSQALLQTGNLNEEGSFQYIIGVKKRSKLGRQSQTQASSMDLYRLREETPVKPAASANDLRLSLPVSMMQISSNWAETESKNSSTDELDDNVNPVDNNSAKKKGRFSFKRVFNWKKNDTASDEITLAKLEGIKLADHLYYKSNYKWTKVWCVLSDGILYGFKSNKPTEKVLFLVSLADANLGYEYPPIGVSKHSRKDFVIELTSEKKSVVVSAPSSSEQIRWIQALTKESMSALRSAFHNSKQESECSDDSACSMSSIHSIPNALASTPLTDTQIAVPSEINSSKLSFSAEDKDNGYTTSSEDFDNHSSISSQNEICDLSLSPCSAPHGTYHAYLEKSLNKQQHRNHSKMDFATTSARPRSFSWNSEKCWNKPATKTPASATLSASVITRPVSLSLGSSPQSKAKSNQKQPSRLSAVTLQLSPQIFMSGYLHRKTQSGKWQRLWFVLKGSTLFSHPKCESPPTVFDSLDLIGCHIYCSAITEKKHCFEITTKDGATFYYYAESEECMATWIHHLHNVTDACSTSSPSISSDGFFDSREDLTTNDPCSSEEQRHRALKQELLTYVLQQIKEIQCRLKQTSDDNEANERQTMEYATCNMTRLVQRRMSTQIKLQSIRKQMNPKKSLFHFGSGSKKKEEKCPNPHLVTEAQELNEKLNEIDRTLTQQQNCQITSSENLNKQGSISPTSPPFALSKTFIPASKSHRLGLKPIWLRNSRPSKDNRLNNRLSPSPILLQSWGTELSVFETKNSPPMSLQDSFLKSLDLAAGASKADKPSDDILYKTLPTKKNLSMSYSAQNSTTRNNKVPKYIKSLDSEIEAFEQLASSYHSRRTEASTTSNA